MFQIQWYRGEETEPWLSTIAAWRMKHFKLFPYLYGGSDAYEHEYVSMYQQKDGLIGIVTVRDQEHSLQVIGISTAVEFENPFMEEATTYWRDAGYLPSDYYYYGELIVDEHYRSQGIAGRLFEEQEQFARVQGYKGINMISVDRDISHPLRPAGWSNERPFWKRYGFELANVWADFEYPTIQEDGSIKLMANRMAFWHKRL